MARMKIVVLTGAGMSSESGLRTFRDCNDGLWNGFSIEEVCTPRALARDPGKVLDFYNMRRREVLMAEPNDGHRAVAELERFHEVSILTQNIDDLHERAGSSHVLHLHGEIFKSRSMANPDLVLETRSDVCMGDLAPDGAQLRPHVCFFEEIPYDFELAMAITRDADVFAVIGTSLQVYPAAGLVDITRASQVVLIDPHPPRVANLRMRVIGEPASIGVPIWVTELMSGPTDR